MINGKKIAALCTSRIYDPLHFRFIKQLNEKLMNDDITLMIFCLNSDLYWDEEKYYPETEVFEVIPYDLLDVLIIMDEKIKCRHISEMLIERADAVGLPVIVLDGSYKGTVSVKFDYANGFEAVVRHMIEYHKVKKPHFIAGIKDNVFSEERINVFKKVIAENGIEFKPSMLRYGDFWATPARKAMQQILDSGDLPDAVICANDIMAINVVDVIKSAGLRVPEDIRVSGFDGYDEADFCNPKITTASCGTDVLAKAIYQSIRSCINKENTGDVLVEPVLMLKGSCGCDNNTEVQLTALTRFNNNFYRFQDDMSNLYEITTAMQMSETPIEAASKLSHKLTHDIHCFVYTSCFDAERNYFHNPLLKSEKYKFSLFYSAYNIGSVLQELDKTLKLKWLEAVLKKRLPLIFNALDYLGKPLGFICYSFNELDIIDYAKTASITNTVSMGLGGFINARYQRFLLDKVAHTYRRDHLTGLYNRTGFGNALDKMLSSKEYINKALTVIMADLDGLKFINDNYGHEAGDTAIAEAAAALRECCPDDALCVRFGGDEMLALIPGDCDPDSIITGIEDRLGSTAQDFTVSMSCGAYRTVLNRDFDLTDAIKQADETMYHNKRARKLGSSSQ